MTGINRSNKISAVIAALATLGGILPPCAVADDLILEGSERLSGKVQAIDADGTVLLATPLAPDAVALRGESVKRVLFSASEKKADEPVCQVTLSNGDVLAASIGSIDDKAVTLSASVAGPLVIPRAMVASLRIGVALPNVIFSGPSGLGGWTRDKASADQWSFEKGSLNVQGSGVISRNFELPQQFMVRFKLAWDGDPNFKFSFAGPAGAEGGAVDRYFFQFNTAGLEIKREASGAAKRYNSVAPPISWNQLKLTDKQLTVEIGVDRIGRTLSLALNDGPRERYKDSLPKAPGGGAIAFASMAGDGHELSISDIQIADWDLKDDRRPVAARGDKTKDALICVEAERFSGSLVGTKQGPDGLLYVFKNAFQDNAIEVPEPQVAMIFLTEAGGGPVSEVPSPFSLRCLGGGSLRVSACTFSEQEVTATHPLLGQLKLQREQVTAFERVSLQPKAEKKES